MFRLAHISDVHLGPLPDVTYRQLVSKRVVGYINWHRNRRKLMREGVLGNIVADIKATKVDHIAVTGDLVNLALDAEIELARIWLTGLGAADLVSVVPGNHDAYVPGAFDKACVAWGPYMSGDGRNGPVERDSFPYMRVRGQVALIGVTTARATAPFMASGFFQDGQAQRLGAMLDAAREQGLLRIVMIHHPPVRNLVSQHKRLLGIGRFHKVAARHGVDLVLHGHSHNPTLSYLGERTRRVPVVGVAAGGQSFGGSHAGAQWNLIEVAGAPGNWGVRLTRRGITDASESVGEISTTMLIGRASTMPATAAAITG